MQVAVLGSGGIGGYYGALLAKTGHDVVFIARGTHLEALQRQGLTVRTPEGAGGKLIAGETLLIAGGLRYAFTENDFNNTKEN